MEKASCRVWAFFWLQYNSKLYYIENKVSLSCSWGMTEQDGLGWVCGRRSSWGSYLTWQSWVADDVLIGHRPSEHASADRQIPAWKRPAGTPEVDLKRRSWRHLNNCVMQYLEAHPFLKRVMTAVYRVRVVDGSGKHVALNVQWEGRRAAKQREAGVPLWG